MCGIAGVLRTRPGDVDAPLRQMLEQIRHRGHSCFETASGGRWALGANRLEIVDAANGRQPFHSDDGLITVVFNGEIYNHKALREELQGLGYRFRSRNDTEVIAQGFRHWGEGLFKLLDGMFAILLFDSRDGTMIAARDPLGVKPIYVLTNADGEFFASEIKALLGLDGTISDVGPGQIRLAGSQQRPFDAITAISPSQVDDFAGNSRKLRDLLHASVAKRVDTELPLAVFLSAGIDSAAVMYEAVRAHPNVTAFSIGLENSSDVIAARRLCSELGMRHRHIQVTWQDLLEVIPEVIWTIESFEPNHVRGGTLSYILSREVSRAGYRVGLCGEGADELFGGYAEVSAAIRDGRPAPAIRQMLRRFVQELHRTQLQRVDRTSMRFALEMREPFLDKELVAFAQSVPLDQKVSIASGGAIENKRVLRAAYRTLLPDWVVSRGKTVLSQGAGFGSNGPEGPFYEHALEQLSESTFRAIQREFPAFDLRNREEAYYFRSFRERFGALPLARQRPLVNASAAEL
jgi:asparagine synthase (glutamine-hydrolysing)